MPILLVDHIEGNELDGLTRKRFKEHEGSSVEQNLNFTYFIMIVVFLIGMIFGSSIHDFLFHGVDRLMK